MRRVAAPAAPAPATRADRVLVAMIERTNRKLLAGCDDELDLLLAADEALDDAEMLGQPDPDSGWYDPDDPVPYPYVTDTPAAQAALRNRADELVYRANAVRIARIRAARPRPLAGQQRPRARGGLRSGRPRTSRRVRARGPSSDDPDPAGDEPPVAAARRSSTARVAS